MNPLRLLFRRSAPMLMTFVWFWLGWAGAQSPGPLPWGREENPAPMVLRIIEDPVPASLSVDGEGPLVRAMFYTGPKANTEVFAFLGIPEGVAPEGGWPAIVLVHGGGGYAFPEWARLWAKRGYVALALDHSSRTAPGWAEFRDTTKDANPRPDKQFAADKADVEVDQTWVWAATQEVIRAGDALRAMPYVNPEKIVITGISWGGYLTHLACSMDNRFAGAIPVYGSGFLEVSSQWSEPDINVHPMETRRKILERWDPGRFVPAARTPMLMLTGIKDRFYHMPVHSGTFRAWGDERKSLSYLNIGHGHGGHGEAPLEIHAAANAFCGLGPAIPRVLEDGLAGRVLTARFADAGMVTEAFLMWTSSGTSVAWNQKVWQSAAASWDPVNGLAQATAPAGALHAFLNVRTQAYPGVGWSMDGGMVLAAGSAPLVFSGPMRDLVPTIPGGVAAAAVTGDSFLLEWNVDVNNLRVTGYEVRLDGVSLGTSAQSTRTVTGATPGATHQVEVRALDAEGGASAWSAPLAVTMQGVAVPERHLFVLSGQSNMDGLNAARDFTPEVTRLLSGEIVVVQDDERGQAIRRWLSNWLEIAALHGYTESTPPANPDGDLYVRLLAAVTAAAGTEPFTSVTFVWMQGETDAMTKGYAPPYAAALAALVNNLKTDLQAPQMNVVIGRLSDFGNTSVANWPAVRTVQVDYATQTARSAWVDTDDLNDKVRDGVPYDDLHYTVEGYGILGKRFAAQAASLIQGLPPAADGRPNITPPGMPRNVAASLVTPTGFLLRWDAPVDAVGVTGYEVSRDGAVVGTTTELSFPLSGLSAGTGYAMRVRSRDAGGNVSVWSEVLLVTTSTEGGGSGGGYRQNFSTATPGVSVAATTTDWSFYRVDTGAAVIGLTGTKAVRIRGDVSYGDTGISVAPRLGSLPDPEPPLGSPGYVVQQFNLGGGYAAVATGLTLGPGELRWRAATTGTSAEMRAMVQVGGVWYVSASAHSVGGATPFTEYKQAFTPQASAWLRLGGILGSSALSLGAAPAVDVSGAITGIGLFQTFSGDLLYLDRVEWIPEVVADLYAQWTASYTWAQPGDEGLDEDPDGDGVRNRFEYAFGSDPTLGSDRQLPRLHAAQAASITLRYRARKNDPGLRYTVMVSPDLGQWSAASGTLRVVDADVDGDGRFELVEVEIPVPAGWDTLFGAVDVGE